MQKVIVCEFTLVEGASGKMSPKMKEKYVPAKQNNWECTVACSDMQWGVHA